MTYAYLQLGRDLEARRTIDEALRVSGISPGRNTAPYAMAMMPARYAVERGAWAEAMQLQAQQTAFHFPEAMTYFARALGAARSGNLDAAEKDAQRLAAEHKLLQSEKNGYWANEVEVERLAVAGWMALARGNNEEALKFMRAAADNEDRSEKHIVTPGRLIPARELLGEMLLAQGQPALALKELETSQLREPNRFRGFYLAALAAQGAGDQKKASEYFARLLAMAKDADSARPELDRARAFIAQR
jgi:tetratricopeptide (TPR) repeat protein